MRSPCTKAKTIAAIQACTRLQRDLNAGRVSQAEYDREMPVRQAIADDYRALWDREEAAGTRFAMALFGAAAVQPLA